MDITISLIVSCAVWVFTIHSSMTDCWRCNLPRDSVFDILIYLNAPFTCFTAFDFDICRCVWKCRKKKNKNKNCSSLLENVLHLKWKLQKNLQMICNFWVVIGLRQSHSLHPWNYYFPKLKSFHNGKFYQIQIIFIEGGISVFRQPSICTLHPLLLSNENAK